MTELGLKLRLLCVFRDESETSDWRGPWICCFSDPLPIPSIGFPNRNIRTEMWLKHTVQSYTLQNPFSNHARIVCETSASSRFKLTADNSSSSTSRSCFPPKHKPCRLTFFCYICHIFITIICTSVTSQFPSQPTGLTSKKGLKVASSPLEVTQKNKIWHKTRNPASLLYSIFQKERHDLILLNNMLKVADLALVLIQYTLYNIDNVSTILSISFWKGSGTSWLQVKMKENKKEMEHFYLSLLNRTRATKKREHCQVLNFPPFSVKEWRRWWQGQGGETSWPSPFPCQRCGGNAVLRTGTME